VSHSDRMAYVADKIFDIVDGKIIRFGKTYNELVKLKTLVIQFDAQELMDDIDEVKSDE